VKSGLRPFSLDTVSHRILRNDHHGVNLYKRETVESFEICPEWWRAIASLEKFFLGPLSASRPQKLHFREQKASASMLRIICLNHGLIWWVISWGLLGYPLKSVVSWGPPGPPWNSTTGLYCPLWCARLRLRAARSILVACFIIVVIWLYSSMDCLLRGCVATFPR